VVPEPRDPWFDNVEVMNLPRVERKIDSRDPENTEDSFVDAERSLNIKQEELEELRKHLL